MYIWCFAKMSRKVGTNAGNAHGKRVSMFRLLFRLLRLCRLGVLHRERSVYCAINYAMAEVSRRSRHQNVWRAEPAWPAGPDRRLPGAGIGIGGQTTRRQANAASGV